MPAARATFVYFVEFGLEEGRGLFGRRGDDLAPSAARRSFTSGSASACSIAWLSRMTISREVLAGTMAPYHVLVA